MCQKTFFLRFVFILISIFLISCSAEFEPNGVSLPSSIDLCQVKTQNYFSIGEKVLLDVEPQAFHEKLKNPNKKTSLTRSTKQRVSTSDRLIALVDLNCERENDARDFDFQSQVDVPRAPKKEKSLSRVAFEFFLKESLELSELEALAKKDPCLLSVGRAVETQTDRSFAAEDWVDADPRISLQTHIEDLKAAEAMDKFYNDSTGIDSEVLVAVVDSGVYFNHEDLADDIFWRQPNGTLGYNVLNPTAPADDRSSVSHGTKVAGVIAATNGNDVGMTGLAPLHSKIMAVKFIEDRSGSAQDRINALQYAVDNGAEVLNLSFGTTTFDPIYEQLVRTWVNNDGVVMVAAAGNDGVDLAEVPQYPASWGSDIEGLITVGGTVANSQQIWDNAAGATNFNNQIVEIGAPAAAVGTLFGFNPGNQSFGSFYGTTNGTSFAAPMVAAGASLAVGLLKTHRINYTPALIEELIHASAERVPAFTESFVEGRHLDLDAMASEIFQRWPQTDPSFEGTMPEPTPNDEPIICPSL